MNSPSAALVAEQHVVGGLLSIEMMALRDPRWRDLPAQLGLQREDLQYFRHQAVFTAVVDLAARGQPLTLLGVLAELERTGIAHTDLPALNKLADCAVLDLGTVLHAGDLVRTAAADRRARMTLARAQGVPDPEERQRLVASALEDLERAKSPRRGLQVTSMDQVQELTLSWLWASRIPFGSLTLLCGDPGQGKSVLTCHLASIVSTGGMLPGDQVRKPVGNVLLIAQEDQSGAVVKPRLRAAGAATERILYTTETPIYFPNHIDRVQETVIKNNVSLVIVDPLNAYVAPHLNAFSDQELRQALQPLGQLAEQTGAAVLVVAHLNKRGGGPAAYRVGGSIGMIGVARSALLLAPDPAAPEKRILAPLKQNLTRPPPSLAFHLEDTALGQPRLQWLGETAHTAEQLLAVDDRRKDPQALRKAMDVLRSILEKGPVPAVDAEEQAEAAGVTESTLKRAKKRLRVVATRVGGAGAAGKWVWSLPADD
jgi:hypothetical protein